MQKLGRFLVLTSGFVMVGMLFLAAL